MNTELIFQAISILVNIVCVCVVISYTDYDARPFLVRIGVMTRERNFNWWNPFTYLSFVLGAVYALVHKIVHGYWPWNAGE